MPPVTIADELEAAWAAVHDATPAAMRVARTVILIAALVLAGCLPTGAGPSTSQIPPSFASFLKGSGHRFTVAVPTHDTIPAAEILARLGGERGGPAYFPGIALGQPVYGILSCVDAEACREGGVAVPDRPVGVWFVPLGTAGGDGWAVMDATRGILIWPDG